MDQCNFLIILIPILPSILENMLILPQIQQFLSPDWLSLWEDGYSYCLLIAINSNFVLSLTNLPNTVSSYQYQKSRPWTLWYYIERHSSLWLVFLIFVFLICLIIIKSSGNILVLFICLLNFYWLNIWGLSISFK